MKVAMILRKAPELRYSDVSPRSEYVNRRRFLASAIAAGALSPMLRADSMKLANVGKSPLSTTEPVTPREIVTTFNNYYEFGTQKNQPAQNATKFQTRPWTVSIEGEVAKPKTLDLDAIMRTGIGLPTALAAARFRISSFLSTNTHSLQPPLLVHQLMKRNSNPQPLVLLSATKMNSRI